MTTQDIACNTFAPLYTNNTNNTATLSVSVTNRCGGNSILGLYDVASNNLVGSPVLHPGINMIQVPPQQYLALFCAKGDHDGGGGGCTAEYSLA